MPEFLSLFIDWLEVLIRRHLPEGTKCITTIDSDRSVSFELQVPGGKRFGLAFDRDDSVRSLAAHLSAIARKLKETKDGN